MKYGYYYTGRYEKINGKYVPVITMGRFEELKAVLSNNNIKLNVLDCDDHCFVSFTIYDNHKNFEYLYNHLNDLCHTYKDLILNMKFIEFSQKELLESEYLQIWVKKQIINVKNENDAYEKSCYYKLFTKHGQSWYKHKHFYQIKPFILNCEPKMNSKTAIYSIDTGFHEIFVDRRIKELVESNSLKGFVFDTVYLKKHNIKSENIFQLRTENIINEEDFVFGSDVTIDKCAVCGKINYQYKNNHAYQFHIKLSNLKGNDDIYMSNRIFQDELYSIYIISQRFYRLLKENKLNGWLDFIPIIDESD